MLARKISNAWDPSNNYQSYIGGVVGQNGNSLWNKMLYLKILQ